MLCMIDDGVDLNDMLGDELFDCDIRVSGYRCSSFSIFWHFKFPVCQNTDRCRGVVILCHVIFF